MLRGNHITRNSTFSFSFGFVDEQKTYKKTPTTASLSITKLICVFSPRLVFCVISIFSIIFLIFNTGSNDFHPPTMKLLNRLPVVFLVVVAFIHAVKGRFMSSLLKKKELDGSLYVPMV